MVRLLILSTIYTIIAITLYSQNMLPVIESKGESPYFEVPDDFNIEQFPLLSTKADVTISAMMADVQITQSYVNRGNKAIEAVYVFPASTRAAVYGMEMKIGDRTINAEIRPKQKAREMYEEAKNEGRSASLLEQRRPNVFSMNVANIMPGDTIVVSLKYTEMIIPEELEYEFVLPTVVGPRYISKINDDDNPMENVRYVQDHTPGYDLDINITMNTFIPMDKINSSSHKINIKKVSENQQIIKLADGESKSGNRDFILKYRPAGDRIETGLLLHEGERDNYFMLVIQPPKRVKIENVVPREFIFVIDVSGSMNGFPIEISKASMEQLLRRLRPNDLFNVILFASGTNLFSDKSLPASDKNLADALHFFNKEHGFGGTELMPALELALNMPHNEGYSKSIVVMTDGLVGVDKKAVNYIRKNLDKANLYSFGIGGSINRFLIEAIALAGAGEPLVITQKDGAEDAARKFIKYIESPVMTDVRVEFDGFLTYDVEPVKPFDLTAERPIIVYGKYVGSPSGSIILKGKTAQEELHVNISVDKFGRMDKSNTIKYIYARNRLKLIEMYDNLSSKEPGLSTISFEDVITEMGMKYNLLTQYTSFVAIDSEIRNENEYETINQPLPTPDGMDFNSFANSQVLLRASSGGSGSMGHNVVGIEINHFDEDLLDRDNAPTKEGEIKYNYFYFPTDRLVLNLTDSNSIYDFTLENKIFNGHLFTNNKGEFDRIEFIGADKPEGGNYKKIEEIVKEDYIKAAQGCDPNVILRENKLPFAISINLPDKFRTSFEGKIIQAHKKGNYRIDALLKEGNGKEVSIGKKAEIEVLYYDENNKLLSKYIFDEILGFGEVPDEIANIANKARKGSEILVSFVGLVNSQIYSPSEMSETAGKVKYIIVKVL